MKPTVTGLVLTYNGERLLKECLQSMDFCDEILVVDSESTDRTREIAEEYGAKVLVRAWEGPVPQFHYALEQIKTDWVVSLDQDEYFTDELRENIIEAIRSQQASSKEIAGFYTPRCSYYFNRFMRHSGWYPDHLLRVFRNGKMNVEASGAHYSFHPLGNTEKLEGDIIHYPYSSFAEHLHKVDSYAQQGAESIAAKGKKGGVFRGITHGTVRFIKLYLLKQGFKDGRAGFINAVHGAFYTFMKYVRVEELTDKTTWGKGRAN
ncbi:MAG: glycosyltransferase family 2 protein [Desulfovibrio sp.]